MKIISAISALAFLTGLGIAPASAQTNPPTQPSAAQGEKSGSTAADAQSERSSAPAAEKSAVPSPPAAAKANTATTPSEPKAWYSDLKAEAVIGKDVIGKDGKKVGEIDALAKDKDQRVVAIIGVGGFLGIGEKNVAVPLRELQRAAGADRFVVAHTEDELKAMPKFAEEQYQRVDKNATLAAAK